VVEHVEIEGLGHAWSGGAAGGSYTDPRGPSASAAIWDFFARVSA
jgi:poly(3-hydroxybutyrate) depolymerase